MSRIGKRIINIPTGVTVTKNEGNVEVKGPKGTLIKSFRPDININIEDNTISLSPAKETILAKALWGTYGSHLLNMITGVTNGFEKKLIIEGVGFKSNVSGSKLVLDLGFSHTIDVEIPKDLTVTAEKNVVTVSGFDKELVGQFAATVRAYKKTEPYKGKGIRYEGEFIRRKQGKKTVS